MGCKYWDNGIDLLHVCVCVCVCEREKEILSESFSSFSQTSVFCFCLLAVGHVQLGSECAFIMYLFF